jgi:hypothetical protein
MELFYFIGYRLWLIGNRDGAVGIATGYGLDDRGVGIWIPVESIIFSSLRRPDRLWGLMGTGSSFLEVKVAGVWSCLLISN